jgi:butyryl-CoA dehydrogenase
LDDVSKSRNCLIDERTLAFQLYEVLGADALCQLDYFAAHSRQTFDLFLKSCRDLARRVLFDSYRPMDREPPRWLNGHVQTHPLMASLYPRLVELGVIDATFSEAAGGQQLPWLIMLAGTSYLAAANVGAFAFCMLTAGAANLIEVFASETLKQTYLKPMLAGTWTGTMALTEPEAGSSVGDLSSKAIPTEHGYYAIDGAKIFISGGDNDFAQNTVHLMLARIDGAPPGVLGISLFVVPKLRVEDGELVDNDVKTVGLFHKLGWRGIPAVALRFGEEGRCRGYLVGQPNRGLSYMLRMMTQARLGVGCTATATAMVAYHEALAYAKTRLQGRRLGQRPDAPQVRLTEHADVRRMLVRQKAIVEGSLHLLLTGARWFDLAEHGADAEQRARAADLLETVTPVIKSFAAERGYEANSLAVQVLGGYGYTDDFLLESWLRDQKLNSLHEGTTGIHSLELLGRRVLGSGGRAIANFSREIEAGIERATRAGVDREWIVALQSGLRTLRITTQRLCRKGRSDRELALRNSADYLDMFGTLAIAWCWLEQAAVARVASEGPDPGFYASKLATAQYWFAHELPKVAWLGKKIVRADDAFVSIPEGWL